MIWRRLALGGLAVLFSVGGATAVAGPAGAFTSRPPAIVYNGHVFSGTGLGCLDTGIPANTQLLPCSSADTQQFVHNSRFMWITNYSPSGGCLDEGAGLN